MTKQLHIDPQEMRQPGFIEFNKIPVNQYKKTIEQEKKNYSKEEFLRIYRDMRFIRLPCPAPWPAIKHERGRCCHPPLA